VMEWYPDHGLQRAVTLTLIMIEERPVKAKRRNALWRAAQDPIEPIGMPPSSQVRPTPLAIVPFCQAREAVSLTKLAHSSALFLRQLSRRGEPPVGRHS
jgi:hypothetical protein